MSRIHLVPTAAAMLVCAAAWPALAAQIPQDRPTTIDGIRTVCAGVGESKGAPRWSSYPVKLVFDNSKGQYSAGESVTISKKGRILMRTRCDAPWLLLKQGAGSYRVTATLKGPRGLLSTGAEFSAKAQGPQQTVVLAFPAARAG